MPNTLQIKRGLQINLPTGLAGELLYTSDTKRLYIGDGATNNLLQGASSILTTGMVSFSDSSGKLTGSSSLYWDNTNGRLGIGGTPSTFNLDVVGTARFQGSTTIGTTTTAATLLSILSSSRADFRLKTNGNSDNAFSVYAVGGAFGSNYAQFGTNDGENASHQGGAIYTDSRTGITAPIRLVVKATGTTAMSTAMSVFNTTNIGIGTTTDAGFKLDVNGIARVATRIDAGTFTPGAGATAYTIATTGRISAANGISFRSPVNGDSIFIGFSPVGTAQIEAYTGSTRIFVLGGAGADLGSMATATPNFNPSSGTGNKNIFEVNGNYNTTGTFSGTIRGFYYNPNLVSMTGVTAHYAYHGTSGAFIINSASPNASAILQADSTTKGFLPPRMTTTQINAIASPAEGLTVYNTTISHMCFYQAGSWVRINHSPM
jgi:hypothetical protein